MTGAIVFLLYRTTRNRAASRLKRLRQPRYLISALAGAAYVYFVFMLQFVRGSRGMQGARFVPDADVLALVEAGIALLLLLVVLAPWLSPAKPTAVLFNEAEIQFFFPAPISRRALLRFRIAKGQVGILFGVLVSALIFARPGFVPHRGYLFLTFWAVYTFLGMYRLGTSLAKTSLAEHGVSGLRRQAWVLCVLIAVVVCCIVWWQWYARVPVLRDPTPRQLLGWLNDLARAGPAWFLLLPFRALVRPAFAQHFTEFLDRLLPALLVIAAAYWWVLRSHASFEEAAMERAEAAARRLETAHPKAARKPLARAPRIPFRLEPHGPPFAAFLWKNLISIGRISPMQASLLLAAFALPVGISLLGGQNVPGTVGSMAAGIALFLTILGPVVVRNDLRHDLLHMEMIKPYPLPGWSVVLGELLGPAAVLAAAEWLLILLAAALLPSLGGEQWSTWERVSVAAAAAILCPCLSLVALQIQNAAALVVPGWMQLGKRHQRGIEAMGQRLITMMATALVLLVAVFPAAVCFAVAYFATSWIFGLAIVPIAALVAGTALISEAALAVVWLGRMFERIDVSGELSAPYS